jgi:Methyltransferase domain/C-methyltransferase C-terminal domain
VSQRRERTTGTCPACGGGPLAVFHAQHDIPTNSCLLLDADEAVAYPRGEMQLAFCRSCGFLSNVAFDPALSEYSSRYEETQGYSARFVDFATGLARHWVDKYDLRGGTAIEIGCGKGEFLEYLIDAGLGHATGIDPGLHPERLRPDLAGRITARTAFYDAGYGPLDADAVICRHTLEHIPDVARFVRDIRAGIGDRTDTIVLFELPDIARILDEVAFWDVYYEHCSYFSAGSLGRLFRSSGFEVLHVERVYDDQYLVLEARPSTVPAAGAPLPIEDDLEQLTKGTRLYEEGFARTLSGWRDRLGALARAGGTAVIWGSGSKGVSFLTNLGMDDAVRAAVDINPHRQGKAMIGTGHLIVGPDALADIQPQLVIAMNPIYLDEIQAELDRLGLPAELVAV